MRHLRIVFGLALSVCAFAVAASPALAAPVFRATAVGKEYSEAEPGVTKGVQEGQSEFNLGGMIIICPKAVIKGHVTWTTSKELADETKLLACFAKYNAGPKKTFEIGVYWKTPLDFVYHSNGFAETGGEFASEIEIGEAKAELRVDGVRGRCVMGFPAQTVPITAVKKPESEFDAVTYNNVEVERPFAKKNFPSGFQKQLQITDELFHIKWEVVEGCRAFEISNGLGRFLGTFQEQVVGGNLELANE